MFITLKSFRVILYLTRIRPGEPLLLWLERVCLSSIAITVTGDRIECRDRNGRPIMISGEERMKLGSWVEVDFGVAVLAEVRPYLFLHLKFSEILTWLRKLSIRAIDYFTPKLKPNP